MTLESNAGGAQVWYNVGMAHAPHSFVFVPGPEGEPVTLGWCLDGLCRPSPGRPPHLERWAAAGIPVVSVPGEAPFLGTDYEARVCHLVGYALAKFEGRTSAMDSCWAALQALG